MPKNFYLATYEFGEKINVAFNFTDGQWEGAIGECLIYDGKLTDLERKGIEKYLTDKWLSTLHLQTKSG